MELNYEEEKIIDKDFWLSEKESKKYKPPKKMSDTKLSVLKMQEIENQCQPLVDMFKKKYINDNPNKENNYLIDIFMKWSGNCICFFAKYHTGKNAMNEQEFEKGFVSLEYMENGNFCIAYLGDTGEWFTIIYNLRLNICLETIEGVRSFHPKLQI